MRHNKISNKNIRATALKEFWGSRFDDSIYLWEGAKHKLTLSEIDQIKTPTLKDIFATNEEITHAFENCKKLYFKFSQLLAEKLNEIHHLNLPVTFWRTALGYWLFRHIHIVHEKYSYLSRFDINKTDIQLLDEDSFFIPNDHFEYLYCFCHDFGVQQLVSQYYYLFKNKKKEFPIKKVTFNLAKEKKERLNKSQKKINYLLKIVLSSTKKSLYNIITKIFPLLFKQKVLLLSVSYSRSVFKKLLIKSKGQIQPLKLPVVNNSNSQIYMEKRQGLLDIESDNDFELYLITTFYYCFPKILIEYFRDYYDIFLKNIQKKRFCYIVSNGWITNLPASIYLSIAQHNGKKFISQEHAAFNRLYKNNYLWFELCVVDKYINTGWKNDNPHIIEGGVSLKKITSYQFNSLKKNILFVGHVRFPYLMQYGTHCNSNSNYIKSLKIVDDFINLLPEYLREYFILRPRRADKHFWDNESTLDVKRRNINIDNCSFSDSIQQSRIIIIDHISTGVAEILLMNAPCLIIFKDDIFHISKEFENIFKNLISCGVVHNSAQSAIEQLSKIYDDVESWWKSETVQTSINQLRSTFLAPPSKTTDYLLSCLDS